jgi:hypothetical protein
MLTSRELSQADYGQGERAEVMDVDVVHDVG